MSGFDATRVWPDRRLARARFDAIAADFADTSFLHDEARARLLERLDFLRIEPQTVVDLGCGPGRGLGALAAKFPQARLIALDSSPAMLAAAGAAFPSATRICSEAESLPFPDASIDLIFANLLMPWCDPQRLAGECARVLREDGLVLISTVGPDTLAGVRRAWRDIDDGIHVHGFVDMHDLGDLLGRAGLAEPVMDLDRMTITYRSPAALVRDLTGMGARNSARGRNPALTARSRWQRFEAGLEQQRRDGVLPVGIELIFAQAWGRGAPRPADAGGPGEIAVPIDRLGRR